MGQLPWTDGTDQQRALVAAWLESREKLTARTGAIPEPFQTRSSCGCGTCPSFEVIGLILDPEVEVSPSDVEGDASGSDGSKPCGIIVFPRERAADFEIYPISDDSVAMEDLDTFEFRLG